MLALLCLAYISTAGCALVRNWANRFADQAASCLHLEQTSHIAAMREPCRYADALAQCFELPEPLRGEIHRECETHRDRLVDEVLPSYTSTVEG